MRFTHPKSKTQNRKYSQRRGAEVKHAVAGVLRRVQDKVLSERIRTKLRPQTHLLSIKPGCMTMTPLLQQVTRINTR